MQLLELLGVFLGGFTAGAAAVLKLTQRAIIRTQREIAKRGYVVRTSDKELIDPPLYLVWDHDDWRLDRSMVPSRFNSIEQADIARKVFNRSQKERKHLIIEEAD